MFSTLYTCLCAHYTANSFILQTNFDSSIFALKSIFCLTLLEFYSNFILILALKYSNLILFILILAFYSIFILFLLSYEGQLMMHSRFHISYCSPSIKNFYKNATILEAVTIANVSVRAKTPRLN